MKNLRKIIFSILIIFLLFTLVSAQDDIVEEFKKQNGDDWTVGTHPWGLLNLATKPRPEETGLYITGEQAIDIAEDFVNKNARFFGLETLTSSNTGLEGTEPYRSWVVDIIGEMYEGYPLTRIQLMVLVTKDGQVFGVGDVEVCTRIFQDILEGYYMIPSISEEEAINSTQNETQSIGRPTGISLTYTPSSEKEDFEYLLAWDILFDDKRVLVDARDGTILSVEPIEPRTSKDKVIEFFRSSRDLTTAVIIIVIISTMILIRFFSLRKKKSSAVHGLRVVVNRK